MMEPRMKLPMFDDYWIDFRCNTTRRWFSPEMYSTCKGGAYSSLIYDPERRKYRLFYEELIHPRHDGPRKLLMTESDDLIHFKQVCHEDGKAELFRGSVSVHDGTAPADDDIANIAGIHGASVLYDPYDKDPQRRYKLCGMLDRPVPQAGKRQVTQVSFAFSPDGVHWEAHKELVANPQTSDTLNKLYYNPLADEYTLLHRSAYVDRRISMRTSRDLENWSEAHTILHPGPFYNNEGAGTQQYAMTAGYFDGIFYGLVWRYNVSLYNMDYYRMFGYMEPELVFSYDGREFLHTTDRPLIERPYPPNPGCTGLSPQDICESADGKHYFILCTGGKYAHGTEAFNNKAKDMLKSHGVDPEFESVIYRIRKDGFCGIESVCHGGTVITKGMQLLKDDLSFNIRANSGCVRFALMHPYDGFLEGFGFDDCIPFEFDEGVDVRPRWKEHSLSEVVGQHIRVAVELNTAILHCISGTARPYIRQAMQSYAIPSAVPVSEMKTSGDEITVQDAQKKTVK